MYQELRKKRLCKKNKNWKTYGPLNMAVKKRVKVIDMITKLSLIRNRKKKRFSW